MPLGDIGDFYDANNVLVGPAVGFIAPADTELPDDTTQVWDPASWVDPWVPAGATEQGWQVNWNPTTNDVNIDEQPTPVDQQLTTAQLQFVANLAEDTIQTWQWALNGIQTVDAPGTGAPGKTTLRPSSNLLRYAVALETQNQEDMPRRFYSPRCTAAATVGAVFSRSQGGARLVPVTFTSICQLNEIVIEDITAVGT